MAAVRPKRNVSVRMVKTPEELADAKTLMREVALERNWPADSVIDGYEDRSLYWLASSPEGFPIGAVKLVYGDPGTFPIKKDGTATNEEAWPKLEITEESGVAEVVFAAIKKGFRGDRDILLALYSKMYWDIQVFGVHYIYAILDRCIHLLYRRMGLIFEELGAQFGGGRKIYWGEETFPARLDLNKMIETIIQKKPETWNFIQSYYEVA